MNAPRILPAGEGRYALWYPAVGAVWVTGVLAANEYLWSGTSAGRSAGWLLVGTILFTVAAVYGVVRLGGAPVSVWAVVSGMCLYGFVLMVGIDLIAGDAPDALYTALWLGNGLAAPLGAWLATIGKASVAQDRLDDGQEL